LAFPNLQSFAVHTGCISDMKMRRIRSDDLEEIPQRFLSMIAGQLGMRNIEANAHRISLAEIGDAVRIDEYIVELLAAEMPGKRRHRLRNDLHSFVIELCEATFEYQVKLASDGVRHMSTMAEPAH